MHSQQNKNKGRFSSPLVCKDGVLLIIIPSLYTVNVNNLKVSHLLCFSVYNSVMLVTVSQILFTILAIFLIRAVNLHEGQNKRAGAGYIGCATYQNVYLMNVNVR
jgi:hypothetical protein